MLENAFTGTKRYYGLLAALLALVGIGAIFYSQQFMNGLMITGLAGTSPGAFMWRNLPT